MRVLAIETATEACSVALFEDGALLDFRHVVMARGHAEHLVPMIAELPGKGRAGRIMVSRGPGSFTGARIGIAAARALAWAWDAELLGYPTLALVAAMARKAKGAQPVLVCMNGGHGEWFVQDFAADGLPEAGHRSLTPDGGAECLITLVAGTRAEELVALRGYGEALALLPDAREVLALPTALLTGEVAPLYGRAPDAKLPA